MRSIFILGASRLQIPAIMTAKKKGLFVYVLDYDPKAIGIQLADKYLEISTIDKEAVLKAALKYKPDYIITSTSDMPVRTVSWVCEELGMKTDISYDDAICATDKIFMRKRMKEFNVPIPDYYEVSNYEEFLTAANKLPHQFVLKPCDNSASRGVVLVDKNEIYDLEQMYRDCLQYSRSGGALVEEFMEGPEVSVESFSIEGEPHIISITDKIVTPPPFFVELGHTEPSRLSPKQQKDIIGITKKAIRALGVKNGPTHTEIKVTESGVKLVEIAARLGGDFITSRLVKLSTGVDMIDCCFASLMGDKIEYEAKYHKGSAIRFFHGKEGEIFEIKGIDKAKNLNGVIEIEMYKSKGDFITPLENSSDRVGHIISIGETAEEASFNAENALDKIEIVYDC